MKGLLLIFLLFNFPHSMLAQSNVFVLVDVSLSVTKSDLNNAKQALTEVLTGKTPSNAFVTKGNAADLPSFKLSIGDKLSVSKFGGLSTTLAINPSPTSIQNIEADVINVLNSSPWVPTDNQTYLTLAKSKIAEYAKNNNITNYKLYIISDNVNDDYGKNGRPHYPDTYTSDLAEGYNTTNNPVSESGYTKLKFSNSSLFTLSFCPDVDVSKYNIPGVATNPTAPSLNATPATIILTSFSNGKKDKPVPTGSNSFTVSWTCSNCPTNTKYNVMLIGVGGNKYKDLSKKNLSSNTVKFSDVPSGQFKIVVTAVNVNSATTFIETPSGGNGWIIILIILMVVGGFAYKKWNDMRNEKIYRKTQNPTDDIFSNNAGGSASGNSSNSDYF